MRNGEMLIGAGEVGREGLSAVSSDDLSRNRDRNIIPRFFTIHQKCTDGTFHEVEYLELLVPGDSKSSPCHLVDDRLRHRYSENYKAFKEGRELPTDGIPIENWMGADNPMTHLLKSMHIRTVEAVEAMSDTVIATIGMGGRELRNRAKKFLEIQNVAKVADEISAKDDVIADLQARLKKLEAGGDVTLDEEEDEVVGRAPAGASAIKTASPKKGRGR